MKDFTVAKMLKVMAKKIELVQQLFSFLEIFFLA
jgi:hypothetical protein